MRRYPLTFAVLLLASCKTICPDPPVPEVVRVAVKEVVPVDAKLTEPCAIYEPKAQTYGEAIEAANKRKASLEECNERLRQIRGLKPPATGPEAPG